MDGKEAENGKGHRRKLQRNALGKHQQRPRTEHQTNRGVQQTANPKRGIQTEHQTV